MELLVGGRKLNWKSKRVQGSVVLGLAGLAHIANYWLVQAGRPDLFDSALILQAAVAGAGWLGIGAADALDKGAPK